MLIINCTNLLFALVNLLIKIIILKVKWKAISIKLNTLTKLLHKKKTNLLDPSLINKQSQITK